MDDPKAQQVEDVTFRLGLRGYKVDDVDALLEKLLAKLKSGEALSRADVAARGFRTSLKGYRKEDVDIYLDALAEGINN